MSRITVKSKDSRYTVVVGFCRYTWSLNRDGFFAQVRTESDFIVDIQDNSPKNIYKGVVDYVDLNHTTSREVMDMMKNGYAPHQAFYCEDEDLMLDVSKYPDDESFHTRANQ